MIIKKIHLSLIFALILALASCGDRGDNARSSADNSSANTSISSSDNGKNGDNNDENSSETVSNESLQVVELPDPKAQFAKYGANDSLLFALENRRSGRDFAQSPLDIKDISAILWAAGGINRDNGNLTIPTSSNSKDMLIYVIKEDGVWLYNPTNHTIEQKLAEDVRQTLEPQVAKNAAMTIYYVQNMDKASNERAGDRHAGSMYQNVGLYCALADLHNVVTGSFSKNENIEQTLGLSENCRAIIAQSIGNK